MGRLLRMAWRNVWRNWRRTVIAATATALGLTFILVFDGMLGGMNEALYGTTVKLQGGHVQVHAPGYWAKMNRMPLLPLVDPGAAVEAARAQPEVIAVSQRVENGGMVSSREGTPSVVITGIEPEQEAPVSLVAENVVEGRWLQGADRHRTSCDDELSLQRRRGHRLGHRCPGYVDRARITDRRYGGRGVGRTGPERRRRPGAGSPGHG